MRWASSLLLVALALAGCGGGGDPPPPLRAESPLPATPLSPSAALGRRAFFDTSLSATGAMACATCHDPGQAHASASKPGLRATPSLRYLSFVPTFGPGADGLPHGGYNWDGRALTLGEQAEHPLLAANEMGLLTRENAVQHLRAAAYAGEFRAVYGDAIFDDPQQAFAALLHSLEQYQLQDLEFRRFDSQYDSGALDAAQSRGLALFAGKAQCAACHAPPLFSDFGYAAILPVQAADNGRAGAFRTPTLRNVARRSVFFHDGSARSLREAVLLHAPAGLTAQEVDDLLAFLAALSDGWRR